jgi:hypothetical protein
MKPEALALWRGERPAKGAHRVSIGASLRSDERGAYLMGWILLEGSRPQEAEPH